jgi:hypothetical protein
LHTRFAYRQYEKAEFSSALTEIAAMGPEVLNGSMKDGVCEVECSDGLLEVVAADGGIRLDNGREVTLQDLSGVAEAYWNEWSEHWKRVRLKPQE